MDRFDELRAYLQTTDPDTADRLTESLDSMERDTPDLVDVPARRPRKGDRVRLYGDPRHTTWSVDGVRGGRVTLSRTEAKGGETRTVPVTEACVQVDVRDVEVSALRCIGTVSRGGDKPAHMIVESENLHALDALGEKFHAAVDCVYIDPPYNTGNVAFSYGDTRDGWVTFMERRLRVARELMRATGVIIAACDDAELHRLRGVMDRVFGDEQYIMTAVWQGAGSALSRFHAGGVDYMLVYAKDMRALTAAKVRWREPVSEARRIIDAGRAAWKTAGGDVAKANAALAAWWKKLPVDDPLHTAPSMRHYRRVDENGRVYVTTGMGNGLHRPNLMYPITAPDGTVHPSPANGWVCTADTLQRWIEEDRIQFTAAGPRKKIFLDEHGGTLVSPVFYKSRLAGTKELDDVLGAKGVFSFPKDTEVLVRWIGLVTSGKRDAVVLDFFGGSGSTVHAVMKMNAADGGTRRCILVTRNEVLARREAELLNNGTSPTSAAWRNAGLFYSVTRPRIETVVTGRRPDGTVYGNGMRENVDFYSTAVSAGSPRPITLPRTR